MCIRDSNDYNPVHELAEVRDGISSLTVEQKTAFDDIMNAVYTNAQSTRAPDSNNLFFINAPAGTGKTKLIETIVHQIRGNKNVPVVSAWTEIAASLIRDGRTVHSVFKLPVPLYENLTCSLTFNSKQAQHLRNAKVIIINEISMVSYHALNAIDTYLKG